MDDWTSLALAARDGDAEALTALVRLTQPHVWRLCAHLADRETADDLTQETYVRALRSLARYRGDSPIRVWLFTIARRVVADEISRRQRRRRRPEPTPAPPAPDHAGAVATEALLAHLDPQRREAFVLTQLLGYPYADAAEICGCPVGTVRSRVARAREQLVDLLGEDESADRTA
ncbi:sigma-70 family RNA polymerase sigma factor [Nocardioides panacisoli]|uniref:sigma-70 family RNA polymerase sigma factor n=1 Tax=Nocardioides panacisoli TaxID=627624 RepID=UPI001C62954E|nr:sigma-70 family RNA polymerase sigma factor [Nocardioides panacisoli]QYJ04630.1 sigma-70 family RNA polymerase sigma factor [Nocardioides panacisoli]